MAKRLTKRTTAEAPKPAPARGKEITEPETTTCKGVETDIKPGDRIPSMGMCTGCGQHAANSEVDHLCHTCHKLKEGFEFDEDQKRWIKKRRK